MASDRRRQRRVRQEAGDFTQPNSPATNVNNAAPSSSNIHISEDSNTAHSSTNQYSSSSKVPANRKKRNEIVNKNFDEKGSSSHQQPCVNKSLSSRPSNVAFAEEKEYEPVQIMESKNEESAVVSEPPKYRRRQVTSNWLKYEELPDEGEPIEGEDYLLGEDFSELLSKSKNQQGAGFLQLKGEKIWNSVNETIEANKKNGESLDSVGFGALKINDLAAAMATIPLHEQLKIPENRLPAFNVSNFNSTASKVRSQYDADRKIVSDIEINKDILDKLMLKEYDSNCNKPESRNRFTTDVSSDKGNGSINKCCDISENLDINKSNSNKHSTRNLDENHPRNLDGNKQSTRNLDENHLVSDVSNSKSSPLSHSNEISQPKVFDFGLSKIQQDISISNGVQIENTTDIAIDAPNDVEGDSKISSGKSELNNFSKIPLEQSLSSRVLSSEQLHLKEDISEPSARSSLDHSSEDKLSSNTKEPKNLDLKQSKSDRIVTEKEVEHLEDWLDSILDD